MKKKSTNFQNPESGLLGVQRLPELEPQEAELPPFTLPRAALTSEEVRPRIQIMHRCMPTVTSKSRYEKTGELAMPDLEGRRR